MENDERRVITVNNNNNHPLTLGTILSALPLLLVIASGFGAYNNLQIQISELRVSSDKDTAFLKETLEHIRADIQELKEQRKDKSK